MTIGPFTGKYRFLSNFYPSEVSLEGKVYPTVEHAFQAAKTLDLAKREYIRQLPSPGQAKKAGRRVTLRPDWEAVKVLIMLDLVRQKFRQADLKTKLIDTFPHELIEINTWNDTYWGVCNGVGANMLGKILMFVRQELLFSKERGWPRMYLCPKCGHDSFVEEMNHCMVARLVDGNLKPVKVYEIEPTGDSVITYECMGCGARWSREDIETSDEF